MTTKKEIILVIDDEVQIRRFLKVALEPYGYQVLEASNGKEGLALAASNRPDATNAP